MSYCLVQELDALFSEWGDQDSHAPVLLAWALVNFAPQHSEGLEVHMYTELYIIIAGTSGYRLSGC